MIQFIFLFFLSTLKCKKNKSETNIFMEIFNSIIRERYFRFNRNPFQGFHTSLVLAILLIIIKRRNVETS